MHPTFHNIQQFIPYLPVLSYPSLWGLLRLLEGITSDVSKNQVSKPSFRDHLKKLVIEVASKPSDHPLLPVIAQFLFSVSNKHLIDQLNKRTTLRSFRNLQEPIGTYWNLLEPSGTFWNLQTFRLWIQN